MKVIEVKIDQIERNDRLFHIYNTRCSAPETGKITKLYNPVWLQETGNKRFRIVDGFWLIERITEHRNLELLPGRIFPEDMDLQELWLLRVEKRIAENNCPPFALLESLRNILNYLDQHSPCQAIAELLTGYQVPKTQITNSCLNEIVEQTRSCASFCDLHGLSCREIFSLNRRKPRELEAIAKLLVGLNLKGNKLQSILQLLDELARGYQLTPQMLVDRTDIQNLLEKTPLHMRYKHLKSFLSALRWPVLEAARKEWEQAVKCFEIPERLMITTDPAFESESMEITLRVSSQEQLTTTLKTLESYMHSKTFSSLFDFI